jgi:hypothetical protein
MTRVWQPDGQFDFRIFDGVHDMAEAIRAKATNGYRARLVARFCWPWSDPDNSGHLIDDVKLNGFALERETRCWAIGSRHPQIKLYGRLTRKGPISARSRCEPIELAPAP